MKYKTETIEIWNDNEEMEMHKYLALTFYCNLYQSYTEQFLSSYYDTHFYLH